MLDLVKQELQESGVSKAQFISINFEDLRNAPLCSAEALHEEIQGQKLYVQVTYLLASEETIQREFGIYDSIRDNFPKYVVSLDEFDMSRDGIKHRNIRDFLLAETWD